MAWVLTPRSDTVGGPGLECLTHRDCAKSLRCYAVPSGEDPFVTPGACREPCVDDLQCPAGEHCVRAKERHAQLVAAADGGLGACTR